MDRRAGIGLWAEHALHRVEEWQPEHRTAVLAVAAQSACARADLPTASAWVDEALEAGVSIDAPLALLPWITRANISLFEGRFDETVGVMARAIEAFDAAGGECVPAFEPPRRVGPFPRRVR